jgi:hypothetical protein
MDDPSRSPDEGQRIETPDEGHFFNFTTTAILGLQLARNRPEEKR